MVYGKDKRCQSNECGEDELIQEEAETQAKDQPSSQTPLLNAGEGPRAATKSVLEVCKEFGIYKSLEYKSANNARLRKLAVKKLLLKSVDFVRKMHINKLEAHNFQIIPQQPYTSTDVKKLFDLVK